MKNVFSGNVHNINNFQIFINEKKKHSGTPVRKYMLKEYEHQNSQN